MTTEAQVREALRSVLDPEIGRPIEDIGMLQGIEVDGSLVRVQVLITIEGCPLKDRITNDVTNAVMPLEGVERVDVGLADERGAAVRARRQAPGSAAPQAQKTFFTNSDTTVIAVASGKGGVGKSSVTVNLACAMAAEGHRVGILDADVWGFSVPRMMGVTGKPVGFNDMILPLEAHGVKVISMGFFVPEETPVIWRGPMLHKAIEQFLGDVYWGDLDFLLGDLPPGTGDVSISLASFLPGAQMLVVTTPQEAARKVAERAGKMAERTNLRPIGVIENMSWFVCPTAASAPRSSARAAVRRPRTPSACRCSAACRSSRRCARAGTSACRSWCATPTPPPLRCSGMPREPSPRQRGRRSGSRCR